MQCKICSAEALAFGKADMLNKYSVDYFQCNQCGFVQTEHPYWLDEAYNEAITGSDVGLVTRNLRLAEVAPCLISQYFSADSTFLDYGGGYGLFVRLMRDRGFDFRWYDKFCQNLLAQGFQGTLERTYELVTAFELVEHLVDPKADIQEILKLSDSFLFSTELLPDNHPTPGNWWYYAPHEGQHISIFTRQSLQLLADGLGLNFYTNGRSIHLLTRKTLPEDLFFHLGESTAGGDRPSLLPQDANQVFASRQNLKTSEPVLIPKSSEIIKTEQFVTGKIVIDGVFFQLYKTGIARLWRSLLEEWSQDGFRNQIVMLDRMGTCPKIPGIQYREISQFDYQDMEGDRALLQAICDEEGADLFISTYYTTPISTPSVFMGYDMIPEVMAWDLSQPMWQSKHHAIRQAIGHITISQNTARDLQQCFPEIDAANITPILCGVAPYFKPASEFELLQFRDRYNIRKPYFLMVGASLGYKNAGLFLEGLAQLASRQGFEVVCTGSSAPSFSAEARKILSDVVFHPLFLDDEELRAAYSGAVALVYPSKYEGFGLPVVEALKCGCPVITCPNASLPEVGGEAVIYVDDLDVNAMSEALLDIQKPQVRQHLIQAGYQQAARFTWAAMAAQMETTLGSYLERSTHLQASASRKHSDAVRMIADYENAIAQNPNDRSLYWHYGLALLLNGQEAEAQTTWLMVLAEAEDDLWRSELCQVLESAAIAQTQADQPQITWAIRQHLHELAPENIENLLHLLVLTIETQSLDLESFQSLGIIAALQEKPAITIEQNFLFYVLDRYLNQALIHPVTVDFVTSLTPYIQDAQAFVELILNHAHQIAHVQRYTELAIQLVQVNLQILPQDFESLLAHATLSEQLGDYALSIASAQESLKIATTLVAKIAATHALVRTYLSSGQQNNSSILLSEQLESLLQSLIGQQTMLDRTESYRVLLASMHLPYLEDAPDRSRHLQNQISTLCETSLQQHHRTIYDRYQAAHLLKKNQPFIADRRLKIGYVCRYFYRHSVGWLAQWLLKNHNPDRVELYIYIINPQSHPDSVQRQYLQLTPNIRGCSMDAIEIAEAIHQDDLDILIELDSLTCQVTCEVMTLKPAPIQVTWLGWDAIGMSSIDYFLADSHVLTDSAQDRYLEKIWRLPQGYIAVDGFEVGVADISRQGLGIPKDAIVFLSAQRGYKRHPKTMQLQMQILQQVPNSYLLIKGLADETKIQAAFQTLAETLGIEIQRLIFLPIVKSEEIHRANLAIADVILDTFPYNGATTTLEALWMERPLVTQVGEQFAARNSYTLLKNAGIEAGIAFSEAEYVEWGVKFGTDADLRRQVAWQLQQSKRSAPLWNSKRFAQQIEAAYQKMWMAFLGR